MRVFVVMADRHERASDILGVFKNFVDALQCKKDHQDEHRAKHCKAYQSAVDSDIFGDDFLKLLDEESEPYHYSIIEEQVK